MLLHVHTMGKWEVLASYRLHAPHPSHGGHMEQHPCRDTVPSRGVEAVPAQEKETKGRKNTLEQPPHLRLQLLARLGPSRAQVLQAELVRDVHQDLQLLGRPVPVHVVPARARAQACTVAWPLDTFLPQGLSMHRCMAT